MWEERKDYLKRKIEAVNKLHRFINMIVPAIQENVFPVLKLNMDGRLSKKAEGKLKETIDASGKDKGIRMYYTTSKHSIYWQFDITHPAKYGEGVEYYKVHVYVFEESNPQPWRNVFFVPFKDNFTSQEIKEKIQEQRSLEQNIKKIQESIDVLISNYRPFLERKTHY